MNALLTRRIQSVLERLARDPRLLQEEIEGMDEHLALVVEPLEELVGDSNLGEIRDRSLEDRFLTRDGAAAIRDLELQLRHMLDSAQTHSGELREPRYRLVTSAARHAVGLLDRRLLFTSPSRKVEHLVEPTAEIVTFDLPSRGRVKVWNFKVEWVGDGNERHRPFTYFPLGPIIGASLIGGEEILLWDAGGAITLLDIGDDLA